MLVANHRLGGLQIPQAREPGAAAWAYREVIDPRTAPERREQLIGALREYCKRDTLGLVRIVRHFAGY
jgi:hypothetical protein